VTGARNTVAGYDAGYAMTDTGNVAIGYSSGRTITSGRYNAFIGYNAGYSGSQLATAENSVAIGYNAYTTASNQIVLGNSSVTDVKTSGDITQRVVSSNVSNPPTDAELDALFTGPATKGTGWTVYIDDSDSDNFYQVVASGSLWMIFTAAKAN